MCCRFNLLLRDSDEKVVCVLRSISPLDTVRPQNKLEAASGVRCQRLEGRLRGQAGNELEFALAAKKKIPVIRMAKKNKEPAIRGETVSRRAVLQGISLAGLALPLMQFLTPSEGKAQGAEQKSGTITEESKMADQTIIRK